MSPDPEKKIKETLVFLYGDDTAKAVFEKIRLLIGKYTGRIHGCAGVEADSRHRDFTRKDAVLITYGDQVRDSSLKPLAVLASFLKKYCSGIVNTVHILPFFPYSSDDGFAVTDYRQVDPELGSWADIDKLGGSFSLMFDAVINHISSKSAWFRSFLEGEAPFDTYFIEADPDADYSEVFRPRSLPLVTGFDTESDTKSLWTTFSSDQIDLNYKSPELLLEIIDVLLFYASHRADLIRLDAIGFLWKEPGTSCIHLPQTHAMVKLFRNIFDIAAPRLAIVTETNVPHRDNISYFGNGGDEASMVYNFSLPPLIAHAVLKQDSELLTRWASGLENPGRGMAFFNFTASHDGIGLVPARGFLPESDIEFLCRTAKERGGYISMKDNPDGSKSPYELNINYFDLLASPDDSAETAVDRFILSQAIMLAMPGVPGIYFHSLFGSGNYREGVEKSGFYRSINREKLDLDKLESELTDMSSRRCMVFSRYRKLLELRASEPAFDPGVEFSFPMLDRRVFAVFRRRPYSGSGTDGLLALHNLSDEKVETGLSGNGIVFHGGEEFEILSGKPVACDADASIVLSPFQIAWIRGGKNFC